MDITNTRIVVITAHPDDEAFGPSGTIAKLAEKNEVYLFCVTKGEAGHNHTQNQKEKIEKIRERELLESAKILGIKKVHLLGFEDGTLSNNLYHKLAKKIQEKLEEIKPEILITNEPRGVSGHIDHIVVSMVTTYVFYKLPFIKTLYYHCLSEAQRGAVRDYFVYFPPGYKESDIDVKVDVSPYWDKKIKAIMSHQSQLKDVKAVLETLKNRSKIENFLVLRK